MRFCEQKWYLIKDFNENNLMCQTSTFQKNKLTELASIQYLRSVPSDRIVTTNIQLNLRDNEKKHSRPYD